MVITYSQRLSGAWQCLLGEGSDFFLVKDMKIMYKEMSGIDTNGNVASGGAVQTDEFLLIGNGQGCGLKDCHCSDGYWISMGTKVEKGSRKIMKVIFENRKEMLCMLVKARQAMRIKK